MPLTIMRMCRRVQKRRRPCAVKVNLCLRWTFLLLYCCVWCIIGHSCMIERGGGTCPEKWRGCADRKWNNPPIHPYFFPVSDPYLQIVDGYFWTYFTVLVNFLILVEESHSNYESSDKSWAFCESFWWILLNPRVQIRKYTHFYRFCCEKIPTHIVRTSPYGLHAFFHKNGENFSEAGIFLTFISYLSDLRPTLPQFYVFKMIVSTLRFMWNRLV